MAVREVIKDGKKIAYDVQVSARHPLTKKRHFLRRRAANKWEANQLEIRLQQELRPHAKIISQAKVELHQNANLSHDGIAR